MRLRSTRLAAVSSGGARPLAHQAAAVLSKYAAMGRKVVHYGRMREAFDASSSAQPAARLYLDTAMTLPVTAMEQTVAAIRDIGGGGHHLIQPTAAARPRITQRVNRLTGTALLSTQTVSVIAASKILSFSGPGTVALSGAATGVFSAGTHAITTTAGSLTLTVSGTVTNASLVLALWGHLPYQWVVSASDYDQSRIFPVRLVASVDDAMYTTNTVDFSSSDEISALAGLVKLSDASSAVVYETSLDTVAATGSFRLTAPGNAGADSYHFFARGSALTATPPVGAIAPAPHKAVVVGQADISSPMHRLFVNGTLARTSSNTMGTGNFGALRVSVFARYAMAAPTLFYNGEWTGGTLIGAVLTDTERRALERYFDQDLRALS